MRAFKCAFHPLLFACGVLLTCLMGITSAQQYYGTLTGAVTAASGAILPNVTVNAINLTEVSYAVGFRFTEDFATPLRAGPPARR